MVATTTGREDNIVEKVRWLSYLSVVFWHFLVSLLSPTCWLWWRDNSVMDLCHSTSEALPDWLQLHRTQTPRDGGKVWV